MILDNPGRITADDRCGGGPSSQVFPPAYELPGVIPLINEDIVRLEWVRIKVTPYSDLHSEFL